MPKRKLQQATLTAVCGSPKKAKTAGVVGVPAPLKPPKSLDHLLGVLESGLPGSYEEQQGMLAKVCASLMTHFVLDVAGTLFRLAELEPYLYHETHPDIYTHRQDDQLETGCWYFHRQGNGSYKGGTYKGMDLTAGNRKAGMWCGILVRSLAPVDGGKVVEGPCLTVNKILELNKKKSIDEFAAGRAAAGLKADATTGLSLKLSKEILDKETFAGPRVGLTLRAGGNRVKYCARPYRFSTVPEQITKFRAGFAAVAVAAGASPMAIMERFNMKANFANEYADAASKGLNHSAPSKFNDKVVNNKELCELVGASFTSFDS